MKQYFINKYIFVAFAVPKIFGKQLRYKPRASARVTLTINQKQSWVWTLREQSLVYASNKTVSNQTLSHQYASMLDSYQMR